jgi:ribosome-associated protein
LINEDKLVQIIADACLEEKALDVVILEVADLTVIADYFVIAAGRNIIQVKSIADTVEKTLKQYNILPTREDGYQEGTWVVLDYSSTILHIFREEERNFYGLENLWGEAKRAALQNIK